MIDQRPRNGHALLRAARTMRRQMRQPVAQSNALQRFRGLRFVRHAMKVLGQHYVLDGAQVRHQVELLKDEPNFLRSLAPQVVFGKLAQVHAIHDRVAGRQRVQSAQNIDQRGLPGAGRTHQRHPFARLNVEGDAVQGAQRAVLLHQRFNAHLRVHASPRNTLAGRTLANRRRGNALAIETMMVMPTETGYTIQRGSAATPNTVFPSQIEPRMPNAEPISPLTIPIRIASAKNSRTTRRTEPPIAFINPTSFLRSIATLLMPAITQSEVRSSTMITVVVSSPLMRL